VVTLCGVLTFGQPSKPTLDPMGDSKGGPDIISVNAVAANGILTLQANFATTPHFDPKTTRVVWMLDTDQDHTTGSPGLLGAPGTQAGVGDRLLDAAQIGAEAVAIVTGVCDSGSVLHYDERGVKWGLAEILATSALPDGFEAYVVLSSLGKSDAKISFKALAYNYSGDCPPKSISLDIKDVAPDVGKPAAVAQEVRSDLPAPQAISPADNSSFSQYPRETTLLWSSVADATAYLVQVQYADPTSTSGWRPLIFRRTQDLTIHFDFVGSQPGRWRVWGVGPSGLAGMPTEWQRFTYAH
jgi:hypothetical protein